MSDRNDKLDESRVERILRSVGRRPQPSEEMSREVKVAVREVWQAELAKPDDVAKPGNLSPSIRGWLTLAASIVIVLTVGIYQPEDQQIATVERAVNRVEYESPQGWQVLPSGMAIGQSRIRTDNDALTSLSMTSGINVRLARNSRIALRAADEITLEQGIIYVDSVASPDASVRIATAFGIAEDIGTQFLVKVHDAGWHVQVRDGLVKMADGQRTLEAQPGDRILISADDRVTRETIPPDHPSWSWTQNVALPIDIEGVSLRNYLDWFERETSRKVRFDSERTRRRAESTILHGSIDGLRPAESLDVVLSSTELTYTQGNGTILISGQQ